MSHRDWAQKQYKTARWRKLRAKQLKRHPYCQCPHHEGQHVKANTVDHKVPHKGDSRLFWDESNLQSMTNECHDIFKQSQESGGPGFMKGHDERGWPLNKEHDWYDQGA